VQVPSGSLAGFQAPGYDDSSWPEVQLPLGDFAGLSPEAACPIMSEHPINTTWNINTDFLLRRELPGALDYTIRYTIDNQAWIYLDGTQIDYGENNEPGNAFCPERDDHAPVSGLLGGGGHVLAIRCRDVGGVCYFDCQIELTVAMGFVVGRIAIGAGSGVA